jgi:CHAT domain-containing protein
MYFDYKNKAANCLSKTGDEVGLIDSIFFLLKDYDKSNVCDTVLTTAIINNFVRNYNSMPYYQAKLTYIDYIIDSLKAKLTEGSRILLLKTRIYITEKLAIPLEQLKSHYKLLSQNLNPAEQTEFNTDLGSFYHEIKEYQLSNIVLQSTLTNPSVSNLQRAVLYNILGNNYLHLKKYSISYYYFSESLFIRQGIPNNFEYLTVIYNNLANYFSTIGKMDSANSLYYKSLEICKMKYGNDSREVAFQYNNLGNHYFKLEKYDSAFVFYQKSFNIKQEIKNYDGIDIIYSLYNLGQTQSKLGNTTLAIQLLTKSVKKNFEIAKTFSFKSGLSSPNDYIISCNFLGDIFYDSYDQYRNGASLDSAKMYYERAIITNDSLINSTPIESSKILVNLSNKKILESYLKCYLFEDSVGQYTITDTIKVLSLFDQCHNYILLNKLLSTGVELQNSVNYHVNSDTKTLDEIYSTIESFESDRSSNLLNIRELSKNLFSKIKELERKKDNYRQNSKKQINLLNEEITSTMFRKLINDQMIILEYTTIKDYLFCLSITNNNIKITKIEKTQELENQIIDCRKGLRQFSLDFNKLYDLSNILLAPLKNISTGINKIVVIKDESFLAIPFDILILSKPRPNFQDNFYLIKKYDISYSYSVALLFRNASTISRKSNFEFIGFAPTDFVGNPGNLVESLSGSKDEVLQISNLFIKTNLNSMALTGSDANFENFYNYAEKTNILHVATHSSVNSKSFDSGLLVNPTSKGLNNVITYYDILNLQSSPHLIVLASCSSNSGKLLEGEGIQNIGRAFSIKGASFIISSLFRLDDKFSCKFTTKFYKNLLASKDIKKSLCKTKREFITDVNYSYPTYWSNFNIIGK